MEKVSKPKFIGVRVTPEFKKEANDLAKSKGISLSKMIKSFLFSELKKESKLKY